MGGEGKAKGRHGTMHTADMKFSHGVVVVVVVVVKGCAVRESGAYVLVAVMCVCRCVVCGAVRTEHG